MSIPARQAIGSVGEERGQPGPAQTAHRSRLVVAAAMIGVSILALRPARADQDSADQQMHARLRAPMVSVIENQSLRESLQQIADQLRLNLWIDRKVDPSEPLSVGQVGPTAFAAIRRIAAAQGCEVFPIHNVVLIGREAWVDRTAASLLSLGTTAGNATSDRPPETVAASPQHVDVRWAELTTPREALEIASGGTITSAKPPLPHDLWPAVSWDGVNRLTAITLVLAQFDRRMMNATGVNRTATVATGTVPTLPADRRGRFVRRYQTASPVEQLRRRIRAVDSDARLSRKGAWVTVDSSAAAHRLVVTAILESQGEADRPALAAPAKFTLRLKNQSAGSVLSQLAGAANKKIRFEAEATATCEQLVSLEAEDATLAELAERIAAEIGVNVSWGDEEVIVRPSEP